MGSETQKKT